MIIVIFTYKDFYIDGKLYYEGQNLSHEKFYDFLEKDVEVKTSQPSPGSVIETWERLLKEKEYVLYIPMSSGLSSSCETATMLAEDYNGKVVVVNNRRISVTQLQSIKDAIKYANDGKSALEIKKALEETQYNSSIYILLETLDFLPSILIKLLLNKSFKEFLYRLAINVQYSSVTKF